MRLRLLNDSANDLTTISILASCMHDLSAHFILTPVLLASALTPVRFVLDGVIHRPWRSSTPSNS